MKRLPTKYLRDVLKREYKKDLKCFICGNTNNLELHHLYSLSTLFTSFLEKNNIVTEEEVKEYRYKFLTEFEEEVSHKNCFTLCKQHHERLHNIYGQNYPNHLVPKVKKWIYIQKEKINGID